MNVCFEVALYYPEEVSNHQILKGRFMDLPGQYIQTRHFHAFLTHSILILPKRSLTFNV